MVSMNLRYSFRLASFITEVTFHVWSLLLVLLFDAVQIIIIIITEGHIINKIY